MKKFFVVVLLIYCIICRVYAAEQNTDVLTKIETSVLGTDYSNQKIETRLSRLEEYVYGCSKSGKTQDRIRNLARDLNSDIMGQEVQPSVDMGERIAENTPDSSVDYPVIKDVERSLNLQSKPNQSLHSRLVAIEKQLFNSVYDTDDFYTRVERIKGKVYKNSDMIVDTYDYYDDIEIPEVNAEDILYNGWNPDSFWQKKRNRFYKYDNSPQISKLEKKILNNTYPDESSGDRLARLENSLFDTEFDYDNEDERINRLEGALKGRQSASKYDSNKFQQHLNTAMQIGAMILMVLACIF